MFLLNRKLPQSLLLLVSLAITVSVGEGQAAKNNSLLLITNHAVAAVKDINANELAAAELKLLQKTYVNDPVSKRLQRLELLTFGTTQYGSNIERWRNIQDYLRDQTNGKKNNLALETKKDKSISGSLNELEKYVYKKTFPGETTSKRLDKLEAKLFGKPSANLPAVERITRLQRTLGLASTPEQMANIPNGMPPGMRGFKTMPYFYPGQPGMPNTFGFGFNNNDMADPDLSQFESQMSQIFREMERQMQDQMRDQNNAKPDQRQKPFYRAPQIIPRPDSSPGDKIPPYNDPNFI